MQPNVVAISCEARRVTGDRTTAGRPEGTASRELAAAAGFACCIARLGYVSRPILKSPSLCGRNHVLDHSLFTGTELLKVGSAYAKRDSEIYLRPLVKGVQVCAIILPGADGTDQIVAPFR